jgi:GT2 family glycosyltransferase
MMPSIGLVAIGRNEGERLDKCVSSAIARCEQVVYVDSGSKDDSVLKARCAGIEVIELGSQKPFTAARARNAGFERVCQLSGGLGYVQFLDGDCELNSAWLEVAFRFLEEHEDVAIVYGRRRERAPNLTIYNSLCDMEWDTSLGESKSCAGDFLVRIEAFREVGGFREDVVAAEDTELCCRLRDAGWKVVRIAAEMSIHDAAMLHFRQWWTRSLRTGYAFGLGTYLHGKPPERLFVRESHRALLWGIGLPLLSLFVALWASPWAWLVWLVYPLQIIRLASRNNGTMRQRMLLGLFQLMARFPEALGLLKFMRDRILSRQAVIIEYK